ncbi:hypothetical protein B9Z65_2881 [Elsinoe australis]|uniref:Uncharacterized protein n=1 Tax=Elsinoe australis TaxID=40998 RepID=A0A2P7ZTV2_9PEZI|nr:hypothetical protein B9Z65_2881 [Elsinoe australis]
MEALSTTPPSGPEGPKHHRSSEHILRRVRGRRSLAALRKMVEPSASATPGRKSRFQEDASVGGTVLPNHDPSHTTHDDARGLTKVGKKLAAFNPLHVFKTFSKTYEDTKDELTVHNIEQNRLRAAQTPVKDDSSPEKSRNAFNSLRRSSYSTLKKVRSEISLTPFGHSSTSLTTKRPSDDSHTIRPSASKKDLRHQRKLSKRVSDLEYQLEKARRDLNDAIKHTSPMPKLPSPYERYTPNFAHSSTTGRQRFTPGLLPTLPSAGHLFQDTKQPTELIITPQANATSPAANELTESQQITQPVTIHSELDSENSFSEYDMDIDNTKAITDSPSKGSLYMHQNVSLLPGSQDITMAADSTESLELKAQNPERNDSFQDLTSLTSDDATPTQARYQTEQTAGAEPEPVNSQTPITSLDSKLKSLETSFQSVTKRKSAKSKKRKSHLDNGDKEFRPGKDDADDDSDEFDGPSRNKKRRKSADKTGGTFVITRRLSNTKSTSTTPKKATRKITKPAPAPTLVPTYEPRPRHSGEGQRSGLDVIDEDAELDISPIKKPVDSPPLPIPSSPLPEPVPTPKRKKRTTKELMEMIDRGMADAEIFPPLGRPPNDPRHEDNQPRKPITKKQSATDPPIEPHAEPATGPTTNRTSQPTKDDSDEDMDMTPAKGPSKLTKENLKRLASEGQWDWPEDVF